MTDMLYFMVMYITPVCVMDILKKIERIYLFVVIAGNICFSPVVYLNFCESPQLT